MVDLSPEELAQIDFSDLEAEYSVTSNLSTDHILLLDQIPKFEPSKEKAFITLLKNKLIGNLGTVRENGIYIPKDSKTGNCKGFLFVEFLDANQAKAAHQALHGRVLDRNHTIIALPFSELSSMAEMPITEFTFTPEPFTKKGHLKSYLCDDQARDQFMLHHGDALSVFWNEGSQPSEKCVSQPNMSDNFQWSTTGLYLASFHQQGIMVSGGPSLEPLNRFSHPGVTMVDFSKTDKFMVTYSQQPIPSMHCNIIIWDVTTATILKSLCQEVETEPIIKWSSNDKHAAFIGENELFLMSSLDSSFSFINGGNQSLGYPIPCIKDITFSPSKNNQLAYWTSEYENSPSRVAVIEIPSFRILRVKNLFNISSCNLYWHPESAYLAVSVDRSKGKKNSSIEIFCLNEKDISVEFMELNGMILYFAWEPTGSRFSVIESDSGKFYIKFYNMKRPLKAKDFTVSAKYEMALVKSFEKRHITAVMWNPKGKLFVLSSLESASGSFEFFSINDQDEFELLGSVENFNASGAEWDPSGRYFATFQASAVYKGDNNYTIWDFRGQTLRRQPMDAMKSFTWRPRPKSLLTQQQVKAIKKDLRSYSTIFDEQDKAKVANTQKHQERSKKRLIDDWITWRKTTQAEWCTILNDPNQFQSKEEHSSYTSVSEWVEEVIEEAEEYFNQ